MVSRRRRIVLPTVGELHTKCEAIRESSKLHCIAGASIDVGHHNTHHYIRSSGKETTQICQESVCGLVLFSCHNEETHADARTTPIHTHTNTHTHTHSINRSSSKWNGSHCVTHCEAKAIVNNQLKYTSFSILLSAAHIV